MTNLLQKFEQQQVATLAEARAIPAFRPGDTLKVMVKVVEGTRERVQAYEGVCIARKNDGINSTFTVRKISYGEGVERVFPLYAPAVASVEVVRRGVVRRAKLYYLRGLTGKKARIVERNDYGVAAAAAREAAAKDAAAAAESAARMTEGQDAAE